MQLIDIHSGRDMPSSQNGFVWDKVSMSSDRMVIRAFAYEWPHNLPHYRLYHDHNVCKTQEEMLNK